MRKLIPGLAVAAAMALSAPAGAASVGGPGLIEALQDLNSIEQVANGCGVGWYRPVPGGRCRPIPPAVVAPPMIVSPPVVVVPAVRWCHRQFSSYRFRC